MSEPTTVELSGPIVFVSRSRIKEGKLEEFKRFFEAGIEAIRTEKPGTLAMLAYLTERTDEVSILHVFPDAAAMDRHLEGADERARAASEFIETLEVTIYGNPSASVLAMFHQIDGTGTPVTIIPELIGGYIR